MAKENIDVDDIPSVITYDKLMTWGLANPLKRHGDSPFQLMYAIYPNRFKEVDFKKPPQRFRKDPQQLRQQILEVLKKENIELVDVPVVVTHTVLFRNRLSGVLGTYGGSISNLFCTLFPDNFSKDDFYKPNGYWDDIDHARTAIEKLLKDKGVKESDIPKFITKKRLKEAKLSGLLHRYNGSPIEIIEALYPGEFYITEFQRVPNRYWYNRENRVKVMRDYCKEHKVSREKIPLLNRAYFRKYFPRFISIADRHYESKFYLWIIESFPEYIFKFEEFGLLVGNDGQVCDSQEELVLHNFLINAIPNAKVKRESERLLNTSFNEAYIPDWIIEQHGCEFLVEYFGLYGSNLYPGYTEKTKRKMQFYSTIKEYKFIAIFPEDYKGHGFDGLLMKLEKKGIVVARK